MPYRGTPVLRNQPGFETGANSRLVKKLITITGNNAIALSFGTEGECFFSASSGDVVVLGPGDMRTAHGSRERVPIEELNKCVACLNVLLADSSLRHRLGTRASASLTRHRDNRISYGRHSLRPVSNPLLDVLSQIRLRQDDACPTEDEPTQAQPNHSQSPATGVTKKNREMQVV
jgi:hypothetical protein